jgi:hypothetical protein
MLNSELEDRLLSKIGQSRAINKIHKCVEANIDFHGMPLVTFLGPNSSCLYLMVPNCNSF